MVTKVCSSLRMVTGVRAEINRKSVQVSIDAKGTKKSKRLKNFARKIRQLERDIKKTFPHRQVFIHIWATDKKSSLHKVSKPFRGRDIIIFNDPVRF